MPSKTCLKIGEKKMKAILVIDMPMMCCECKFFRFANNDDWGSSETICTINGKHCENGIDYKLRVCPLRPLPQRKEEGYPNDDYTIGKADGWNACLDEITGETE